MAAWVVNLTSLTRGEVNDSSRRFQHLNAFAGVAASGKSWRLAGHSHTRYSTGMGKILSNWTYRDVAGFLGENGFDIYEGLDQTECWVKLRRNGEPDRFVEIRFTQGFYSPKAMRKIIRQSGVSEVEWKKWAASLLTPPMK
jgi:hypothetical protein